MTILLAAVLSSTLVGRVVGVVDGDTIDVLENGKAVRVRLAEIDAPEKKQAYGQRSKAALSSRIFARDVRVVAQGIDRYGRTLGIVYIGEENINHWLVREGWAWRYDRYSKSEELLRLQEEARKAKRGLWADEREPVRPWEWRRAKVPAVP